MITLYTHGTPNGIKIAIALEEMDLAYEVRLVDIFAGEGQRPEFLAMSPAGKIPAIRDNDNGNIVYESNAILLYLAEKSGKLFPASPSARLEMMQLLFLQASLQGPMFGQRAHFSMFAPETVPYAIQRYEDQGETIDALVDRLLGEKAFFLGDDLSIVDVSFFGWYFPANRSGFLTDRYAGLKAWFDRMNARPSVGRGVEATPTFPLPPRKVM